MPVGPDWYLHRRNCASCSKSAAWLAEQGLEPREQVDARRQRFAAAETERLLRGCGEVFVARGRSWQSYNPSDPAEATEMLARALGPHGTLRAPAMRFGSVFAVGFHPEMLAAARAAAAGSQA